MNKKKKSLNSNIFWTLLKINFVTFGGGYTIIPIVRQELVERQKLLTDDDMLDIIAIAESGPGAMAISTSYLTGVRINGIGGGLAAVAGSVLPPLVIITIVFFIYHRIENNVYVRAALRGMSGVIVAMLIVSCKDLFLTAIKQHKVLSISLMVMAFVLSFFSLMPVAFIILCIAVIGIISYGSIFPRQETNKESEVDE